MVVQRSSRTDADFLGRHDGRDGVLHDGAGGADWSSADREDEVETVALGERPVSVVARVPRSLERQHQTAVLVRHRRVVHVLLPVQRRRRVALVARPPAHAYVNGKGKVFPYSLPSVGPGADPGVQAVSPQVT